MKKMFLAATAALALMASCDKHTDEIAGSATGSVVKITLTDKTPITTRAFFGATAAAESWEKEIKTLTLYVFDASGKAVLRRNFSASEIAGQAATIPVPEAKPGESYSFHVIANGSAPAGIAALGDLQAATEAEAASYNGTFDEVATKARRAGGFTMTGSVSKAIAAAGQTTAVQIELERLVSKIAVQAATDSKFAAVYPGRVKINSAVISRAAVSACYVAGQASDAATTFSHTQASKDQSGKYGNLVYVYGQDGSSPAQAVLLTLEGIYDGDGDFSTAADQMPVSYEVQLQSDTGKAIARNTYRRVSVGISGLTGADVAVTITPADWEGPFNQDVNLGM